MRRPRTRSQSISFGASSAAAGTPGLEKMPTVLMSGIEQELLVSFRAQDGTLDNVSLKIHLTNCRFDTLAGRLMQLGIADDATLSHLFPAHFELGLDQHHPF